MKNYIAVIPARKGSTRLPNKNIQMLGDRNLIDHAVNAAVGNCHRIVVVTDIEEPVTITVPELEIIGRPAELSTTEATMENLLHFVIEKLQLSSDKNCIVLLQPTSPLRTALHVKDAIARFEQRAQPGQMLLSLKKGPKKVLKNFIAVDGRLEAVCRLDYIFENEQNLPDVYATNGAIYIFGAADFTKYGFKMKGYIGFEMSARDSIDIDSKEDLVQARAFLR